MLPLWEKCRFVLTDTLKTIMNLLNNLILFYVGSKWWEVTIKTRTVESKRPFFWGTYLCWESRSKLHARRRTLATPIHSKTWSYC